MRKDVSFPLRMVEVVRGALMVIAPFSIVPVESVILSGCIFCYCQLEIFCLRAFSLLVSEITGLSHLISLDMVLFQPDLQQSDGFPSIRTGTVFALNLVHYICNRGRRRVGKAGYTSQDLGGKKNCNVFPPKTLQTTTFKI